MLLRKAEMDALFRRFLFGYHKVKLWWLYNALKVNYISRVWHPMTTIQHNSTFSVNALSILLCVLLSLLERNEELFVWIDRTDSWFSYRDCRLVCVGHNWSLALFFMTSRRRDWLVGCPGWLQYLEVSYCLSSDLGLLVTVKHCHGLLETCLLVWYHA